MSETTVLDPPAEAIDATPDEATDLSIDKGTADNDVTVRTGEPESEGAGEATDSKDEPAEEELKHSDSRLEAERESAKAEAIKATRKEIADQRKEHEKALLDLVKSKDADPPAVIRATRQQVHAVPHFDENGRRLSSDEVDAKFEALFKVQGDATSVHLSTATALANERYRAVIDRILGTDAARKEFWAEAEALDPTLDASDVVSLLIEKKALESNALHSADPEDIIKSAPKLKVYVAKERDDAYAKGRTQGRKDRTGAQGSESDKQTATTNTVHDAAWAATAPLDEVNAWLASQRQ